MPSSPLLKSGSESQPKTLFIILTWLFRILFGATFIFSGFVKAIDPWGTLYKFEEYLSALGITIIHQLLIAAVFALIAVEFCVGVFMLLGCYRKSNPIVGLGIMCFMLPLTLWVAVSDPVADCGCFGDALVISNWATFWKNVVLTAMAVWLLRFNLRLPALIAPTLQWLAALVSFAFIGAVSTYGYLVQPMLDFRPYRVGEPLVDEDENDNESYNFVYSRGNEKIVVREDDELPSSEDGWKFDGREKVQSDNGPSSQLKTLRLYDSEDNDVTEEELMTGEDQLLVLMPDLEEVSPATTWVINRLQEWCERNDTRFIAITGSGGNELEEWCDLSMPAYNIYSADDTAVKEVARGNPSLVMLHSDTVVWKTSINSIDIDLIEKKPDLSPLDYKIRDGEQTLELWGEAYICSLAVLMILTLSRRLKINWRPRNLKLRAWKRSQ